MSDVAARRGFAGNGHVFTLQDIFDAFDGQCDLLLVTQAKDTKVFEILPRQLSDILDGAVTLASQTGTVFSQS